MGAFEYDSQSPPTTDEFRRLLLEADETYDPIEELLALERELSTFERNHEMTSSEFYRRYNTGEMGDAVNYVRWAGRYRLYLKLKEAISASLKLVVADTTP